MSWETVKLEKIKAPQKYSLVGGPFGSNLVTRDYVEQGVPVIRGTNLSGDFRFSLDDLVFVSEEKADELTPNNAYPGDVVFTQRGTLGQIGIIPKNCGYERFVISQSQMKLTVDESQAEPLFVYYFFKSAETVQKIHNLALSSGVPHINLQILREFEIPFPPLPTQRRIADVLSAYDDLIENNTRRIRILEQMAQAIYQEWFGKVGKESVPEGWSGGIIRDFCESYNYGYTAKAQKGQDGIKYLRITDIVPDYIDWEDVPSCEIGKDDIDKYLLKEGDIVVARTGATTGYAKRLGKRFPKSIFASYLVRFRIEPNISNHLIGLIVESDEYKKFIQANLGGAAQPMANAQVLTSFPLAIPPRELQKEFDSQVQPLFELKEMLQIKNANLRQTRDLLLPRLVSGEIAV